ncbi:MAG TPA: hypothetical protein VFQ53_05170 [Kofleriaceae bacterium]|nr:hypothetical protein [Kofleriaceae bacterium]
MRTSWLIPILLVAACGARPASLAPPAGPLDGYVIDSDGPVANADVTLVATTPEPCPCGETDTSMYVDPNSIPSCACPAAYARWRERLAACNAPATLATTRTDARGHWSLAAPSRGATLAVASGDRATWLAIPATRQRIALALGRAVSPRFRIAAPAVRGALLFDDGHCVALRAEGDRWTTVSPVPAQDAVLVVEAPGYAPAIRAWDGDDDVDLPMFRDHPIAGRCEPTARTAELANPYQQLRVPVKRGAYRFEHVVGTHSQIQCVGADDTRSQWVYLPENGEPTEAFDDGLPSTASCDAASRVVVTDLDGAPIADARVALDTDPGTSYASFHEGTGITDARGIACIEDLASGGELAVTAPDARGGACAGSASVIVPRAAGQRPSEPVRVKLSLRHIERATWRGRVVSTEGVPIPHAYIRLDNISIPARAGAEACDVSNGGDFFWTAADGTFELRDVVRGTAEVEIGHDWFTPLKTQIEVPSASRDLRLDRGARWTGRLLDPEGRMIESCDVVVEERSSRIVTGTCSARGFELKHLSPGHWKGHVRVQRHPLGTFRTLAVEVTIAAGEHHVEDVRWPAGAAITGIVVDAAGKPVPGARLTALPKGTEPRVSQFQPTEVMLEADATGHFAFLHLVPGTWTIRGDLRAPKRAERDLATGTKDVRFVVP